MSSDANSSLDASTVIQRQHAARLRRVVVVLNAEDTLYESTVDSGTFDTFAGEIGIQAPNAAPTPATGAAGALTGAYSYYVQFWDNNRKVNGSESAQSSTVNPSSEKVDVDLTPITNEGSNGRVTHMDIFRNTNGGSTYYFVARVTAATTSYTDDNTDATISANDSIELDNDAPETGVYKYAVTHKSRVFLVGNDDFIWSKLNNADAFPLVNRTKIERGLYGDVRIAQPVGDVLVFYKDGAIYELHFDQNPSGITGDGYGKTVNVSRGSVNDSTVVNVQGTHYVMDQKGIYQFRGGANVMRLSDPLKRYWERINWAEKDKFSAVQDEDRILFFVALDRDTECHYAFVFDLQAIYLGREPRWYGPYHFDYGIRHATRQRFNDHSTTAQFGMEWKSVASFVTEYGMLGYLVCGYRDMVDPQLTAVGTVTSATTTTLTDTSASFTRTNEASATVDVWGAYVRFLTLPDADKPGSGDWSQAYRITTVNSATQITVTPAMPSAPPAGTVFVVGPIPNARFKTPLLGFGNTWAGKRAGELSLQYQPGGANFNIGYEVELDRRGAEVAGMAVDETYYSVTSGRKQHTIALGGSLDNQGRLGVKKYPMPDRHFNYAQVVLDASGVDKPAIIDAMGIDILEMEGGNDQ